MKEYILPELNTNRVYTESDIDAFINTLPDFEIDKSGGKKSIEYICTAAGYDTEFSSFMHENKRVGTVYAWMFGIYDRVILLRSWGKFKEVLDRIRDRYELNFYRRMVVYVHNLSVEFSYMMNRFNWDKVFADRSRSPIVALTNTGFEFRCSARLAGMKLEEVGNPKNALLPHYPGIKKHSGDLDYKLIRHRETPLSVDEVGYCVYDVFVLLAYIHERIYDEHGKLHMVPLTATGYVRRELRQACYEQPGYFTMIHKLRLMNPETYKQMEDCRRGGDTHGNFRKVGFTFYNIGHADLTSSYPASMCMRANYPMSSFKYHQNPSMKQFYELMKHCACMFTAEFWNIRAKENSPDDYISKARTYEVRGYDDNDPNDVDNNNGRIHSAAYIRLPLVDVDLQIIKETYEWDDFKVSDLRTATRGYLPKPIIETVLGYYANKTRLKGVPGQEVMYSQCKKKANSTYGCMVMSALRDEYPFDGWWADPIHPDEESAIKMYDDSKTRFLYFAWGVWICANSRYALFTLKRELGDDYIYGDTDSAFFTNPDAHEEYFTKYDAGVRKKMQAMCDHYGIDPDLYEPANKDGERFLLGGWDKEYHRTFKCLGAKRYMCDCWDKKKQEWYPQITVAGLGKAEGLKYIQSITPEGGDIYETFTTGLHVPEDSTGKLCHTYFDQSFTTIVKDYLGNECEVTELSGVNLSNTDFSMTMDYGYECFLLEMGGYNFTGVVRSRD